MAERRMFSKSLMHSSGFVCLSRAAFQLYVYLCLAADDDGFTDGLQTLFRICRCSKKHLQELVDGGWVIPFDSGVVAITHWCQHNNVRKDRRQATAYQAEFSQVEKAGGVYVRRLSDGCQDDNQPAAQDRIGKDRIGEVRSGEVSSGQERKEKDSSVQDRQGQQRVSAGGAVHSPGRADAACDDLETEIDFDKILYHYQALCRNLAPCVAVTPGLQEKIRACYRMGYNQYSLIGLFTRAGASQFLCGQNEKGWKADLGWLLEPAHMQEVLDGKYDTWM